MARPENRSEARSLSLTLPEETFNYLVLLAGLGKLGRTENEVATHILVRETYAMMERGFTSGKSRPRRNRRQIAHLRPLAQLQRPRRHRAVRIAEADRSTVKWFAPGMTS